MGGARARCPTLRDSKTRGKWTFTRARGELCANRPQVVQGTCAPTGAARLCPPDALRVIRGRSSGSGETRATELPKPNAAVCGIMRQFAAEDGVVLGTIDWATAADSPTWAARPVRAGRREGAPPPPHQVRQDGRIQVRVRQSRIAKKRRPGGRPFFLSGGT